MRETYKVKIHYSHAGKDHTWTTHVTIAATAPFTDVDDSAEIVDSEIID